MGIAARSVLLSLFVAILACAADDEPPDASSQRSGNDEITARASLLFEPPTIALGEVTTAVILVTTPPGRRVLPLTLPEIPGVWVLESLVDPTEKGSRRWLHKTRVRMRPRETGSYVFPAAWVVIESAEGEQSELELREREFEVVSILPQFLGRTAPFGLHEPSFAVGSGGFMLPAALGAAFALAAIAAIVGLRRLRQRNANASASDPSADAQTRSLWDWAQAEIARAFESLEQNPRESANLGARFMRHYVESRYHTHTSASTTEELAGRKPPMAAHRHWPDFVRVLRRMDELRFRPNSADAMTSREEAGRIRSALEDARSFLESSSPPDRRS